MTKPILFYDKDDPNGVFSNFYDYPINIDGLEYPTTEHYFQAQKFVGTPSGDEYAELIRKTNTPAKCKYLAGQKINGRYSGWYLSKTYKRKINDVIKQYKDTVKINPEWNNIRDNIMRKACYTKFKAQDMKEKLLETGNRLLAEHTTRDKYWGDGGSAKFNENGSSQGGENMLGRILMEIRTLFSGNYPNPPNTISGWLVPEFLLLSRYPDETGVQGPPVKNAIPDDIDLIVNLMEKKEEKEYLNSENDISVDLACSMDKDGDITRYRIRFPIPDRGIVSDTFAIEICNVIMKSIGKHYRVMIHCKGGKRRTGTIAGLILGKMFGLNYDETILFLNESFKKRVIKGEKCCKLPQTVSQKNQLKRILE